MLLISTGFSTNGSAEINVVKMGFENFDSQEVYLGWASIIGNGSNSTLEAVAENDLLIKIDAVISYIDFYIEYNMTCDGNTDEGIITLIISLNGENLTPAIVQTPWSKEGQLRIEDVKVSRGDTLAFVIEVVYVSVIPLYANETRATGAGVISKTTTFGGNPFHWFLERLMSRIPFLEEILNL